MVRRILGVFVAIAAIFAAAYLIELLFSPHTRTIGKAIEKYEFTQLMPPSNIVGPGSIVAVVKDDPLVVNIVCSATDALGSDLAKKLLTSNSANTKLVDELTGSFNMDAPIQTKITSKIDSRYVNNIVITLSDVRIVEIPDSVVFELLAKRSDPCSAAIQFRRGNGQKISMIKSAIQATALYQVHFDESANANVRAQLMRGIAGVLGLTNGIKTDDTIQGTGLIWGVRDDVSLALISKNGPPPTGAGTHPRALPTNKVAEIVADAE